MRLALVVLCVVGLAGCGGSDSPPLLAGGKAAAVRGSLTPDVHLFAEPVVARVDVVVDRDQVDPADVVVKTDFKPYETVGNDRRAGGSGPVHPSPLCDHAPLSRDRLHPEHLQVQRRPDLADAGAAALPGEPAARREAEVRVPIRAGDRRRGRAGEDARPCRLAAAPLTVAHQLVRLERASGRASRSPRT